MYHFIELSILPDESVSTSFIMSKVMDVLHLCLVNVQKELGHNPVGLSFPAYRYDPESKGETKGSLGTKMRLYSLDAAHLERLQLRQQLRRFEDYVHQRSVVSLERPNLSFACFKRVQVDSSVERLARRRAAHLQQPVEEALAFFRAQGKEAMMTDLPFVRLHSQSSEQAFRLFVAKVEAKPPTEWRFSTYGLSATVGVPDV
ncbi:MAG: type I-F CRISPR-associated endoribonuclease Cas6/Csy4 [Thiofilum sp.]|uniref:type I-F CRISPR-associated endoribonuclease Cas6/Csy4 n=1 Tax=Thiofilum sp. TaxID=2212733 RepID=UPI0025EDD324|nr:type I-F CRISPR-associated endoribonuclease Cas6/Csy4 [Thiofilum sp.]MBK8455472.1 type I-F CRISPR-associated endoribonuclease Cas6/Csy4 [Thiofilum sp.]